MLHPTSAMRSVHTPSNSTRRVSSLITFDLLVCMMLCWILLDFFRLRDYTTFIADVCYKYNLEWIMPKLVASSPYAAIVGVAESYLGRTPGKTALQLQALAAKVAQVDDVLLIEYCYTLFCATHLA